MNIFHKHIWKTVYWSRQGNVEQCVKCKEFSTLLFDYNEAKTQRIMGNFLSPLLANHPIYIVAKNQEAFQEAVRQAYGDIVQNRAQLRWLTHSDQLAGLKNPAIFFYGDWWEADIIQDYRLTAYLNGWL